jgi:polar amino acid transport system substrate-binding protein
MFNRLNIPDDNGVTMNMRELFPPLPRHRRVAVACAAMLGVGLLTGCSGSVNDPKLAASNPEAAALLPQEVRDAGVLRFGTNAPYPPMVYFEEDGATLTGAEIDLATAIADGLGLHVEFQNQNWDGLIPALKAQRFDAAIASIGDLPDRQKEVDFVDYAQSGLAAVVPASEETTYSSAADLCGKAIGMQTGAAAATILAGLSDTVCVPEGLPAMDLQGFPDDNAGLLALRSGRTAAHVMDSVSAIFEASTGEGDGQYAAVLTDLHRDNVYGIAVNQKTPDLTEAIQMQLNAMIADGSYAEIMDQYGLLDSAVEKATINAGKAVTEQ